jgi:hypothetical protein
MARRHLAQLTADFGRDHPQVCAAKQRLEAVKLADHISATIPLLTREQIDDIAALLRGSGSMT